MIINSVVAAKAGRFVRATVRDNKSRYTTLWGHAYLPDLINAVKERYGFVRVPELIVDLEVSDTHPATFQHGKFVNDERSILIKQLDVYTNWVIATTESSTSDADAFLSDITAWFSSSYFTVVSSPYVTYLSQLEVVLDASFGKAATFFNQARVTFANALASYQEKLPPDVEMSGFSLHYDTTKRPNDLAASAFTIERRVGRSYGDNVYFTQAPLTTSDHIEVLREIETGLRVQLSPT